MICVAQAMVEIVWIAQAMVDMIWVAQYMVDIIWMAQVMVDIVLVVYLAWMKYMLFVMERNICVYLKPK